MIGLAVSTYRRKGWNGASLIRVSVALRGDGFAGLKQFVWRGEQANANNN
jgi:hypothetical protein